MALDKPLLSRPKPPIIENPEVRAVFDYFDDMFRALERGLGSQGVVDTRHLHAEPAKRQYGMIAVADGVEWDPGSGEGVYAYLSDDAWHYMGAVDLTGYVNVTGTPSAGYYARFTDADTVEGRTTTQVRTDLGLATGDSPQLAAINVGHASDTTVSRLSAGKLGVEGVEVILATGAQTLTDKTLAEPTITGTIKETVYPIPDAAGYNIDPSNGSVQVWTLGANRTPVATSFNAGEGITLMITDGAAYTITWTTVGVTWIGGSPPTLHPTAYTVIELWRVGGTIYGKHVGDTA